MTIRIFDTEGEREYRRHVYSDGAISVRTSTPVWFAPVTIVANMTRPEDVMELLLVTDAIRRDLNADDPINLVMPYVPYAREDRVCNPGEALGARVFCDLINSQNYDSVEIWDAHSDVVPALLNRVENIHCSEFVRQIATANMTLVAPDAGAAKKVGECARAVGAGMIIGGKKRDTASGEITGSFVWATDIADRDFLIVDDICDGGRTFIELAKLLRNYTTGKIRLYVTHGIMSQGMKVFDGLIDEVFIANPFPGLVGYTKIKTWPPHASVSAPSD